MPQLVLTLLGAPRIERDSTLIDIPLRKAVALLAYLAVTGVPHTRDTLAALFWPEADGERARGALRYTLGQLKAALGDGWLDSTRAQIHLPARPSLYIDAAQISALASRVQAHGHALTEPCAACVPLLQEIVASYGGALLAGFHVSDSPAFDDWLLFESERLQRLQADALSALIAVYQAAHDPASAIPYAQRLVVLDPLDEAANHLLIGLYVHSNQSAAALRHYGVFAKLLHEEFDAEPEEATAALIQGLTLPQRDGDRPPHRLTAARVDDVLPLSAPLIGRAHELDTIGSLLDDPACRLLTLLGPGGSGKTSLALAIAHMRAHRYTQGAAFVQLAGLSAPGELVATIAAAIGSPRDAGEYTEQRLLAELSGRQLLLVLDNLEHLLERAHAPDDAVANLLDAILVAAPDVQILVTSRVRARLYQEQLYPVGGLDYPEWDDGPDATHYGAVELFVQRARRLDRAFALTPATTPSVVQITRLLAGQPLAIELAAAWVATLSPKEIAAELQSGIDLLASDARNVPLRHRSMRACYTFSWERLAPAEQAVQQALSVFRGSFTRDAAEQVAGASARTLQALSDQSLVHSAPASGGATRYGMHELLRQFAAEQLARDPEREAEMRARHAAYYAALMEQATVNQPMAELWVTFERERPNLLSALTWMRDHNQLFATRLARFWRDRGRLADGLAFVEALVSRAEAQPTSVELQAQVYYYASMLLSAEGDLTQAHAWLRESLTRYQALNDRLGIVRTLNLLGRVAFNQGDVPGAIAQWQAMLDRAQERPDSDALARERLFALNNLGEAAAKQGALAEAQQHAAAALAEAQALERPDLEALQLETLGTRARQQGTFSEAQRYHGQALRIWQTLGEDKRIAHVIEQVAATLVAQGRPADGARLLGAAARLRTERRLRVTQSEQHETEQTVERGRAELGGAAWTAAFDAGATLAPAALLDEVLALTQPTPPDGAALAARTVGAYRR